MVGDHQLFEIKTGQVSNSAAAAQWRATIGQPSKRETAWLKTASAADKARHNEAKNAAIMERKQAIVDAYSKEVGHPVKPKTLTLILDPDRGVADLFVFDGFHKRIGYNGDTARKGYVGSFRFHEGEPGARRGKAGDLAVAECLRGRAARGAGRIFLWLHRGAGGEARDIIEITGGTA
jgi:hypothetical protein